MEASSGSSNWPKMILGTVDIRIIIYPEIQLQWTCYDLNTLATSLRGRSDVVLAKYILTIQCLSLFLNSEISF